MCVFPPSLSLSLSLLLSLSLAQLDQLSADRPTPLAGAADGLAPLGGVHGALPGVRRLAPRPSCARLVAHGTFPLVINVNLHQ